MQLGPPGHTKGGGGRATDAAGRRDGRGAAGGRSGLQQPGGRGRTLERVARQPGEAREDAALRLALEVANSAHGAVIFACGVDRQISASAFLSFSHRVEYVPEGSSSTTPAHSPGANCVSPMKAIWPGLVPPTHTLLPMMKLSVSSVSTTLASAETAKVQMVTLKKDPLEIISLQH